MPKPDDIYEQSLHLPNVELTIIILLCLHSPKIGIFFSSILRVPETIMFLNPWIYIRINLMF